MRASKRAMEEIFWPGGGGEDGASAKKRSRIVSGRLGGEEIGIGADGVGDVAVLIRRGVEAERMEEGLVSVDEVVGRGCSSSSEMFGGNIRDDAEAKLSRSSEGKLDRLLARDRIDGLNNAVFGSPSTRNIELGDLPGVASISTRLSPSTPSSSSRVPLPVVSTLIGYCLDS